MGLDVVEEEWKCVCRQTGGRIRGEIVVRSSAMVLFTCVLCFFFFFQAEDGIRDLTVTGVQTCALPISPSRPFCAGPRDTPPLSRDAASYLCSSRSCSLGIAGHQHPEDWMTAHVRERSEEHTSELQSQSNLVCRLLLEKKKINV